MTEDKGSEEEPACSGPKSNDYIFKEGVMPPHRQTYYQYCDLHVPEVQELLQTSILENGNKVCCEKNGWIPEGVEKRVRDIFEDVLGTSLGLPGYEDSSCITDLASCLSIEGFDTETAADEQSVDDEIS